MLRRGPPARPPLRDPPLRRPRTPSPDPPGEALALGTPWDPPPAPGWEPPKGVRPLSGLSGATGGVLSHGRRGAGRGSSRPGLPVGGGARPEKLGGDLVGELAELDESEASRADPLAGGPHPRGDLGV